MSKIKSSAQFSSRLRCSQVFDKSVDTNWDERAFPAGRWKIAEELEDRQAREVFFPDFSTAPQTRGVVLA
jgi:hypothetical protein